MTATAAINIAIGAYARDRGLVKAAPYPPGALGLPEAVPGIQNLVN